MMSTVVFYGVWTSQPRRSFLDNMDPPLRSVVTIEVQDGAELGPTETPIVTARLDMESFDLDNEEHASSLVAERAVHTPMDLR